MFYVCILHVNRLGSNGVNFILLLWAFKWYTQIFMTTQYILQCILLLVQLYLYVWNKTVSQSVFTHFSHMLLLGALQNLSYQVFRGSSPSSSPSLTQCSPSGFSWVQLSGSWSAQKDKLLDEGRKEMITLTSKQHIVNGKKNVYDNQTLCLVVSHPTTTICPLPLHLSGQSRTCRQSSPFFHSIWFLEKSEKEMFECYWYRERSSKAHFKI